MTSVHGYSAEHHYVSGQRHHAQQYHSTERLVYPHGDNQPRPAYASVARQYPPPSPGIYQESGGKEWSSISLEGQTASPRPHTSHPVSATQPPPPHHPAVTYPYNDQRQKGSENGFSAPPAAVEHQLASYPPPTSIHQPSHGPDGNRFQTTFYSEHKSSAAATKKGTRASQACDGCRQQKAKCDEAKPCKTCRDKGRECLYRDPHPKKNDNDLGRKLESIHEQLKELSDKVASLEERNGVARDKINNQGERLKPRPSTLHDEIECTPGYYDAAASYPHRVALRPMTEGEVEVERGPPVPPGEPAIPINHTTHAGLLLSWPIIKDIVKPHLETKDIGYVSEYPKTLEEHRDVLPVYGRGDVNSDLSDGQVWEYVESFRNNILNMHPIVAPSVLSELIEKFLKTLPPNFRHSESRNLTTCHSFHSNSTTTGMARGMAGSKRKRSSGTCDPESPPTSRSWRPATLDRTTDNALILTILALGKICQERKQVRDPVRSTDRLPKESFLARGVIVRSPSPNLDAPSIRSSHSQYSVYDPSPKERTQGFQSRESSRRGSSNGEAIGDCELKNHKAIPGLEYFAHATDILGNHIGNYASMNNVYALIFAGLYCGQLARPVESFGFIQQASNKLLVQIGPILNELCDIKVKQGTIREIEHNRLALTFWTCLQLESDLIAELQLPPSGLLSYVDKMPHPNMGLMEGFDERVLDSYLAHLYLRNHLNNIHREFYAPDETKKKADSKELDPKFNKAELIAKAVVDTSWIPKSLAFKEEDPPANDILGARLRAKYWGAQVLTYRPFIGHILQQSDSKSQEDINLKMIERAKQGIKALIESTRAFHGLGSELPIMTNTFGTLHAQWGNLLVLSAAFRTRELRPEIDEEILKILLAKTIQFLLQSSTATSSLRIDMHILQGILRDIFGESHC